MILFKNYIKQHINQIDILERNGSCMNEDEIMQDFDEDKCAKLFCKRQNCCACDGMDYNGESNGYGCEALVNHINTVYQSILIRRKKKLGLLN